MNPTVARFTTALAVPALAALGGAFMVFSGYDDSPGGSLIGLLMIVGAVVLSWRAAKSRDNPAS